MDSIHHAIARTRRRLFLDGWLRTLGWMALAWVGLAAGVLLAQRLLGWVIPVDQAWVYGSLGGALFVLAPVIAWVRRADEKTAATMMDTRLGLKDSLGTALYAESLGDDPFAKQVLADASELASRTRVDEAFKIGMGRGWGIALPAGAVLLLMAQFVPSGMDLLGTQAKRVQEQRAEAEAEQVHRQVLEANAMLKDVHTKESELSEADPDEVFKELASLTKRDLTNPEFRKEAITKLADVQEKLSASEQAKKEQIQTVKNQMSQLDPGKRGPADRFADAMRRGDFEQAQKELQRIADSLEGMPDAEKQVLKQQLDNMTEQLKKMAEEQKKAQQQTQQNIQQQLKNAGLSQQQINQLQQQGYNQQAVQQSVQQSLQKQGMNQGQAQQQAQQIAKQVSQQQQQSQNSGQSQSQFQGMGSSLGQMSQSLGQPGQQPGQQGQQGGPHQQQNQFSQGAWQTQQQLSQMQQMQQQLSQMQNAQQQMQQAMNVMSQGQGQGQGQQGQGQGQQGQGQGQGMKPGQGGGKGGHKAGSGVDNQPLGREFQTGPYATRTEQDLQERQGRVIASWQEDGPMSAGQATVEFDNAITEARTDAEHAITEDRVPRRYHSAIKEYFQQLPDTPEQVRQAPAAPR